ncbi:MAG TPA: CapA family protein [Saprospiraceae bacterium]|nr:CapA family protein [Saprospiraceae bacterium]HMQ84299.1 CapA family protein [Saprospiraceae bacterium]
MNSINFKKDFHFGGLFFIMVLVAIIAVACQPEKSVKKEHLATAILVSADTVIPQAPVKDSHSTVAPTTFTIVGVGDMMLGTNYPSTAYLPPNGGRDLLAEVSALLSEADVTFGNLEGTILDKGGTAKTCRNPDACYVFRSPESYAKHFVDAGFDFLSIANNHSGDFGATGRTRTKEVLKEAGIAYAGLAGTDEYAVIERNGLRFGLCAFAPNSGTCSLNNIARAKEIVEELNSKCDILLVSFHGGAEGASHQHVPKKTELFLGENRGNVYEFAHTMIDAGADIIFGHGPHVTRAMELYKDRLICYSLGNFCTYGRFSLSGPAGLAPLVSVEVDSTGAFLSGQITATYQQKTHGPKIDAQKRVISSIRELTKADFPQTPLLIDADGKLARKED